jgi:hypothetical protein
MKSVKIKNTYWDIAADLYFPPDFDLTKNIQQLLVRIQLEAVKNKLLVMYMVQL